MLDLRLKALDKYEEVEGRPYDLAPIEVDKPTEAGKGFANTSDCLCTADDIRSVHTWAEMGVPARYDVVSTGVLRTYDGANVVTEQKFTRITIDDDDDSESDNDLETGATRIAITCDDSDEEEEALDVKDGSSPVNTLPAGFTRIDIAESDSEDEEEVTTEAVDAEKIEELKLEGNKCLQSGDIAGAISTYSSCLDLIHSGGEALQNKDSLTVAVLNNRAFAYLKSDDFNSAVNDTSGVLAIERQNPKALYRRALAHEGLGDAKSAMEDVKVILSFDHTNALALELGERLTEKLTESISAVKNAEDSGERELLQEKVKQAAMKCLADGDYHKAIAKLEEAIVNESGASNPSLEQLLLTAYRGTAQDEKVITLSTKMLNSNSENVKALMCRGNAYLATVSFTSCEVDTPYTYYVAG